VFEDPAGLRRCLELIERDGGGDDAADGVGAGMFGRGVRAVAVRVKNRYDGEYDASESAGYRCDGRVMTMHDGGKAPDTAARPSAPLCRRASGDATVRAIRMHADCTSDPAREKWAGRACTEPSGRL
jgi:hypothetical protein